MMKMAGIWLKSALVLILGCCGTIYQSPLNSRAFAGDGVKANGAMASPKVRRLPGSPIIRPDMFSGSDGENINGPSMIRVPDWVKNRLGTYYLYFVSVYLSPHCDPAALVA
jgi:hypothetical protein